jgi:hypothetical protein
MGWLDDWVGEKYGGTMIDCVLFKLDNVGIC